MTDKEARKRAAAEYKQRKRRAGVFAVRCSATGHAWVGATPTLDTEKNRRWFMLRTGVERNAALLAEWRAHGEDAFTYEVLEELEDDVPEMLVSDQLASKTRDWAARENAPVLLR
jgi:hypothetical protein